MHCRRVGLAGFRCRILVSWDLRLLTRGSSSTSVFSWHPKQKGSCNVCALRVRGVRGVGAWCGTHTHYNDQYKNTWWPFYVASPGNLSPEKETLSIGWCPYQLLSLPAVQDRRPGAGRTLLCPWSCRSVPVSLAGTSLHHNLGIEGMSPFAAPCRYSVTAVEPVMGQYLFYRPQPSLAHHLHVVQRQAYAPCHGRLSRLCS